MECFDPDFAEAAEKAFWPAKSGDSIWHKNRDSAASFERQMMSLEREHVSFERHRARCQRRSNDSDISFERERLLKSPNQL